MKEKRMGADKKVAVVTGAGRGIGRAIAKRLAKDEILVILNYNGSKKQAEEVREEILEAGGMAEVLGCDVSDEKACERMFQEIINLYGRIDILVNNAGITRDNLLMRMSEEEFDQVIQVNLKGAFHCMKHTAKQMLKQRSGRIINISSVSGVTGNAGQVNYAAAKAGMIGMTKSAARELAGRGITVNAIAPGFIDTDMTKALPEGMREVIAEKIPLKRFGKAEDVAEAAAFFASEGAGYITGQVLCVDGGMVM